MSESNEQSCVPVKAVETKNPMSILGSNTAKISIILAVIVIAMNLAAETVLQEQPAAKTAAALAARAAVLVGVSAALAGLIWAFFGRGKDAMILAGAGLLLNAGLFVTGFGGPTVRGRHVAEVQDISAGRPTVQTISSKSGRTIETRDWTAGFVTELTDYNFDEVVEDSRMPVLVDFYATWCRPCRKQSPIIEQVAQDYEGKARVCKLDVDVGVKSADRFNVSSIPTIILFDRGKVKKRWRGTTDRAAICLAMNKLLEE
ncbi:MAG: thioredoxin [Sedimentisphaerales bacterium]|nr:thioredoxin [Sedimentisphaerales bacterium]